jgi:adenine-specific DNA-methyltransferase
MNHELVFDIPFPNSTIPSRSKPKSRQSQLGQFMTPSSIARFMAGMFSAPMPSHVRLLDAGAGRGALTRAFVERWAGHVAESLEAHAYEYDEVVIKELQENLSAFSNHDSVTTSIIAGDFIQSAAAMIRFERGARYTHAILNPPYKKINNDSECRHLLRMIGLETVNLYSGFVGIALELMEPGGQLVAIIPRSFCNGPYYKPFRAFVLRRAAIPHIHLFESRSKAFKEDAVLQENVIIHLVRNSRQGEINISTSTDETFEDYREKNIRLIKGNYPLDTRKLIG